ncbi:phage tail protein [Citrobacter freundii]|nr:phage tail protein [Citrobacter freundii]
MNYFKCVKQENIYVQPAEDAPPLLVGGSLDVNGDNYYDFQKTITQPYTCVISTETGIVRYIDADASAISPHAGESVFGIDEYPEGVTFDGFWVFDGNKFTLRILTPEELAAAAEYKKSQLMARASEVIAILERAVKHGMATDAEVARLAEWEKYSVRLSRFDTFNALETDLPEAPDGGH